MALNKLYEVTLYTGAGNAIAADYTVGLLRPNGYGYRPLLYVAAVGGTGACAFYAVASTSATTDAAILAVNNRLGLIEPNEIQTTETQTVTTAASPGTKRYYYVASLGGAVGAQACGIMGDYLHIDIGTNTWDADVVATVTLYLYGG